MRRLTRPPQAAGTGARPRDRGAWRRLHLGFQGEKNGLGAAVRSLRRGPAAPGVSSLLPPLAPAPPREAPGAVALRQEAPTRGAAKTKSPLVDLPALLPPPRTPADRGAQ